MHDSVYYDTCIFINSLNKSHNEAHHCAKLLIPEFIKWQINFSEITYSESSIGEFLKDFHIQCVSNGISIKIVTSDEIRIAKKEKHRFKKKYEQQGLTSNDWAHLISAIYTKSNLFLSTDEDFWDSRNKSNNGPHFLDSAVTKRSIYSDFSIIVHLPSTFLSNLT